MPEALVEDADRVVVHRHRRQPPGLPGVAPEQTLGRKALALRLLGPNRPLEVDEVLQDIGVEGRELHDNTRRQIARFERKVGASEARLAAESGCDVPHGCEMAHLLDGDVDDRPAPAADRLGLDV